jgi:hypothetical protein
MVITMGSKPLDAILRKENHRVWTGIRDSGTLRCHRPLLKIIARGSGPATTHICVTGHLRRLDTEFSAARVKEQEVDARCCFLKTAFADNFADIA